MAGREPFGAVLSALRRCYAEAVPLETFVRRLGDGGAGDAEVLRDGDAAGYRTFVGQCLVCVPHGARAIPRPFTFQQLSSQSEVTTRVVQRLCEKKKKNILAYGYSLPDEHSSQFPILPLSKIHSYLPNSATETLRISSFWETLLSRIGDDVMMYILEHCAVFMLVPPSNCYQVCGQPVYELISHNVDSSLVFVRQRVSKRKRTSLLKYMQKRLMFHRNYLSKSHGWKYRQRRKDNVSRMGNKRKNKRQSLVPRDQRSAKAVSKASKQIRKVSERREKQSSSSSCVSATAPSRKRKIRREQPEIPAKRAKIREKAGVEKACSLTPDVNQSSSERSKTGCVAPHSERVVKTPHISQRSNSAVSGPSLVRKSRGRKKAVAGKSSLPQGIQSNRPLESNTEMQAESCGKRVEMITNESRLASGQTKPVKGISSKCRRQKSRQLHLSKKLPNRLLGSAVYIERTSLLYSCRSFRECFPKSFVLNRLQGSQAGGRWLVKAIFLSQNQGQQGHNQNQGQQRLNQNQGQQGHSQNQGQQGLNQNQGQQGLNQNQGQQGLNQNQGQQGHSQNQGQQGHNQNQGQQGLNQNQGQQGHSQNQGQQGHNQTRGRKRRNQTRGRKRHNQTQEQQRLNQTQERQRLNQTQEQQRLNQTQEQQRLNQTQGQQGHNQTQGQQRINQTQEQQRLNQTQERQRLNQTQEQQRLNQTQEQQRLNQTQEQQRLNQTQERQRLNQTQERQRLNQTQERQRLNQTQGQQRLNQTQGQQGHNQTQEQQRLNQTQGRRRLNQTQERRRRNQNQERQRLNENQEQQRLDENQEQQRLDENQEQQRLDENQEQQRLNENQEQQRLNENQPKRKQRKKMMPKRYWQMRHTFQKLIKNHGKCPYLALLRKNCPVSISDVSMRQIELCCQAALPGEAEVQKQAEQFGKEPAKCVTSSRCESGHMDVPDNLGAPLAESECVESPSEEQNPREARDSALRELLKQHSSHWQVYLFVRECLEKVIPAELWGSNHNKCRFLKNVKVFISRGKFDKLSLQELMWRMRVNDCMWLRLDKGAHLVPADEHCFREELLAKFLFWLMDTYVAELLRSFFYITETMFQKNMLFYYRKFIWGKLQNIGIRNHFVKVQLRPLSSEEIKTTCQKKFVPVASKLRFIPKPNGLRPIVKVNSIVEPRALSKESREKKMNHYNTQLKNLFAVLNYERTRNTSIIGSSVFGRDDIYKTWKQFVTKVLESGGEIPHFYCVKADVSRAFDTIPHNKLVEVISQVLKPEKRTVYCIRCYAVIMITPSGKAKKLFRRHVSTFKDFMPDMKQFVSQLQEKASLRNAIVVEQSLTFNETSSSLFNFFLQMIHSSILKIWNRYYLQCCGIPQGCILSTLLCSLFYGDMENKLLSGIQQDGVLIRLIDDFLLLTPHLMKARTFLRILATGIPEYGLLINPNKTMVNFPVDDIPGCSKFKQLPDCLIPWCGLLLDLKTLEVYCDYSSYTYTSIKSSLSFNSSRTAGKNMKYKLSAVLKLKCHRLFLDLQINSLKTVLINIYKIFLLQAYRFHACVLQLPFNQQVRKNPRFFLRIVSQTASCCYAILKTINAGIAEGDKGVRDIFPIQAAEWLCYHAFTVKLSNHRAVYKCLLTPLKVCKMQLIRKIPEATVALLQAVTNPSLCQDFKTILG